MQTQTKRRPGSVNEDDWIYGVVAMMVLEKEYGECFSAKGYTLHDVSKIREYQDADIDYVIDRNGGDKCPSLEEALRNKDRYIKLEVKCDTNAYKFRHTYWEYWNKGKNGWSEKTKCDFLFYANPEKDFPMLSPEERRKRLIESVKETFFINMEQFRKYKAETVDVDIEDAVDREERRGPNGKWYRKRVVMDEDIVDIDFDTDEMRKAGIIEKYRKY